MSWGVYVQGVSVQGVSDRGVGILGGKCPGVSDRKVCVLGVSVLGVHVWRGGGGSVLSPPWLCHLFVPGVSTLVSVDRSLRLCLKDRQR